MSKRSIDAEVSIELEVPFHDVDMLRVVWHGHYYKYMEIARTELLKKYGLQASETSTSGFAFVVIESKCRHTFPLRLGDRFRVGAAFRDTDYRIHIAFELYNLTHARRCAYGHTMLATVDHDGNLQLRTPDAVLARLRA